MGTMIQEYFFFSFLQTFQFVEIKNLKETAQSNMQGCEKEGKIKLDEKLTINLKIVIIMFTLAS